MKIIDTFELVEDSLYSVQYENEELNEFDKCFKLWNDPIYLREFFEENRKDLENEFWRGITIEQAILKTREEAEFFEQELLEIAEVGKTSRNETLSTLFEPLSKGIMGSYEKDKAKVSWLRIYAIRIDLNLFVISGGAIKLTATMNETESLILELNKLEFTKNYLLNTEDDNLDFVEIT